MRCPKCGAKMYLGGPGWKCSGCGSIEEAVLMTEDEWMADMINTRLAIRDVVQANVMRKRRGR